jgi:hypothetical protein
MCPHTDQWRHIFHCTMNATKEGGTTAVVPPKGGTTTTTTPTTATTTTQLAVSGRSAIPCCIHSAMENVSPQRPHKSPPRRSTPPTWTCSSSFSRLARTNEMPLNLRYPLTEIPLTLRAYLCNTKPGLIVHLSLCSFLLRSWPLPLLPSSPTSWPQFQPPCTLSQSPSPSPSSHSRCCSSGARNPENELFSFF